MEENGNRADAKRLLAMAKKLLRGLHLKASRDAAVIAQQNDPLLEGADQILAVVHVLIAASKRINGHRDLYSILQVDCRSEDNNLIKKQYRRVAYLLDPETNDFPFADNAFKLVTDAWSILSNSSKKSLYDKELGSCPRTDSISAGESRGAQKQKRMVNSKARMENQGPTMSTFWTAYPYCYMLFEYPRICEGCGLRCQHCERAFHGVMIPTLPPVIPEKEAYYCTWAFFPFLSGDQENRIETPHQQESERDGGIVGSPPRAAAPTTTTKKSLFPLSSGGQKNPIKPPPGFPEKLRESDRDGGAATPTNKASERRDNVASDFAPRKKGRPM